MLNHYLRDSQTWYVPKLLATYVLYSISKLIQKYSAKIPGGTSSRQCPTGDHLSQENEHGECDSNSTVSSAGTSYIDPCRPITQQRNMTGDEWDLEEEHMGSIEERLYTLFLSRDFALPEDEGAILSTGHACSAIVDTSSTITFTSDTYSIIMPLSDLSDEEWGLEEII